MPYKSYMIFTCIITIIVVVVVVELLNADWKQQHDLLYQYCILVNLCRSKKHF